MYKIIRLLLIFVIAIAAAIAFVNLSERSVHIELFAHNINMKTSVFIVLSVITFSVCYYLIRFLSGIIHLPAKTKRWKQLRNERYRSAKLNEASLQYFAGHYTRSLKNVKKALLSYEKAERSLEYTDEKPEFYILANLLAAANEHRLGNQENSVNILEKAIKNAQNSKLSNAPDGLQLLQIEWLLQNNQLEQANNTFNQLDPSVAKRVPALELRLEIDRKQNKPISVLKTVKLLAKKNAYTASEVEKITIESACKLLENTHDAQTLQTAWDSLDKKDKKIPAIIAYAARHFAILGDAPSAQKLIENAWPLLSAMPSEVKDNLLLTLDMTLDSANSSWLNRLEKAMQNTPDDAMMIYLAGRLCEIQNMPGKAQSLLEKAARHPQLPVLLRQRAWFCIAQQAEKTGEIAQANACYKEAIGLLN